MTLRDDPMGATFEPAPPCRELDEFVAYMHGVMEKEGP